MPVLMFHKPTEAEENGAAGHDLLLDVSPDTVIDEVAEYRGALIRTAKPGWAWWARSMSNASPGTWGSAETKEQAIEDGLEALEEIRTRMEQAPPAKKRRWFG